MSKILEITKFKNPILRQKAIDINELSTEVEALIDDMIETLNDSGGVGLAAPQINEGVRLVIIKHKDKDLVLLNPEIIKKSWKKNNDEEGCLSLPGVNGFVRRHSKITVKAKNRKFEDVEITGRGLLARIFQHEIDHLDGILFVDRAHKITEGKELL
ncbi:MAG: peptide deformylase [bacterium]